MPKKNIKHDYKHTQHNKLKKNKKSKALKPTLIIPLMIITGIIFAIKYKENQNFYAHKISNSIEQNKNGKNKHTKTYDLQITA